MNRGTWKAIERDWAERLGGQRVPVTGRQRGSAPDIEHPVFGVEIKAGKVMSTRMQEAVEQAVACSQPTKQYPDGKVPFVGITQSIGVGKPNKHYALMRWEDFAALLNDRSMPLQDGKPRLFI